MCVGDGIAFCVVEMAGFCRVMTGKFLLVRRRGLAPEALVA